MPNGSEYTQLENAGCAAVQASEAMESIFKMMGQHARELDIAHHQRTTRGAQPTDNWLARLRKRASVNIYLQVFALLSLLIACAVVFGVVSQ